MIRTERVVHVEVSRVAGPGSTASRMVDCPLCGAETTLRPGGSLASHVDRDMGREPCIAIGHTMTWAGREKPVRDAEIEELRGRAHP